MNTEILLPSLFSLSLLACRSPEAAPDATKAIAELSDKISKMDKKLDRMALGNTKVGKKRQRPSVGQLYKLPVSDKDAYRGGEHAKVTIAIASEFACPYCAQLAKVSEDLLKHYSGDNLKVVSKHFVVHPGLATQPALSACAAGLQGKYAEYEDTLWAKAWPGEQPRLKKEALSEESLASIANDVGLNMDRWRKDIAGPCKETIARNRMELSALGVNGTPAMYVNGVYYGGPRTLDAIQSAVDKEIAKADTALAKGATLSGYYASVIAKGKTSM